MCSSDLGEAGREVGRGRRLAHAPLLVRHAENPSHAHIPSKRHRTHNACSRNIGSSRPGIDVVSRENALTAQVAHFAGST